MDVHTAFSEYLRNPTADALEVFLAAADRTLAQGMLLTPDEAQMYRAATGAQPLPVVPVVAERSLWPWALVAGIVFVVVAQ